MISDDFETFIDDNFWRGQTKTKILVQKIIHFIKIQNIHSNKIFIFLKRAVSPRATAESTSYKRLCCRPQGRGTSMLLHCWQKSCDFDAPLPVFLPRELFVVGVTCRPAHRTALLTLPQFSPTPRWQISNGLFPHLPTDSPPLFHLSPAEFRTFDASSTHVGYANSVILIKILLLCHKFVWKIQWSSYIWYKNQLPRDFASKENLWTWTEEEREKNAQVAPTWRGQACPFPDRWRGVLYKDYLFQCKCCDHMISN